MPGLYRRSGTDDDGPRVVGVGARYEISFTPKLWPIYTSVRMLEGARNIATYCHFPDECRRGFAWDGCSLSSMIIIK